MGVPRLQRLPQFRGQRPPIGEIGRVAAAVVPATPTVRPDVTLSTLISPIQTDAWRIFPDSGIFSPNLAPRIVPNASALETTHPLTPMTLRSPAITTALAASAVAAVVVGGMWAMGSEPDVVPGVDQAGLWGGLLGLLGTGWDRLSSIFSSSKSLVPIKSGRPSTPVAGVSPVRRPSGTRPARHADTTPIPVNPLGNTRPNRTTIPPARRETKVTAPGAMVEEAMQVRLALLTQQVGSPVRVAQNLSEIENVLPQEGKDGIFVVVKRVDGKIEVRIADRGNADRLVLEGEHKMSGGAIPMGRSESIISLARIGGMLD